MAIDTGFYTYSDEEALDKLRRSDGSMKATFDILLQLLGSESAAVKAYKAENEFVIHYREFPYGKDSAARMRRAMIDKGCQWTIDTLAATACALGYIQNAH